MIKQEKVAAFKASSSVVEIIVIVIWLSKLCTFIFGPVERDINLMATITRSLCVCWVHLLAEFIEFVKVMSGHGFSCSLESFFEVISSNDWHWVFCLHSFILGRSRLSSKRAACLLSRDCLSDGGFCGTLAELCNIGTSEVLSQLSAEVESDIRRKRTFSEVCFKDVGSRTFVRQRDVDELIETTWADQSFIKDIRSVGCTNEEKILFDTCAVHLSQKLVEHTVTCSTASSTRTSSSTNGIKLIEEKYTW